ncbi:hypothetical protein BDK51DRAFT_44580 [Blyttiomyces helicus]|uniref:Uncharacterized protein n=1 Tax=Blyttiomyces helicus TaxID=388810 RepID=A0A4P9WPS7_9FUNG|nr:hypothetical protein BDK51DRAFT_44580 [Blyttiomyces helicus]|eukprot:RKO93758.1 hypothetical protein BDK51DRAFT_44580 [Blyttiomyces helicus]
MGPRPEDDDVAGSPPLPAFCGQFPAVSLFPMPSDASVTQDQSGWTTFSNIRDLETQRWVASCERKAKRKRKSLASEMPPRHWFLLVEHRLLLTKTAAPNIRDARCQAERRSRSGTAVNEHFGNCLEPRFWSKGDRGASGPDQEAAWKVWSDDHSPSPCSSHDGQLPLSSTHERNSQARRQKCTGSKINAVNGHIHHTSSITPPTPGQ